MRKSTKEKLPFQFNLFLPAKKKRKIVWPGGSIPASARSDAISPKFCNKKHIQPYIQHGGHAIHAKELFENFSNCLRSILVVGQADMI